ncbi:MAG: cellulase family glycosylhydrolase [Armatimonadetes bacterium]|nr:cellulase family glycosylhydrolase [Armatimonadota bacterium]
MPWAQDHAWNWYNARPWVCGFNYVPRTAINSTEMWQDATFDPDTMDQELGWASHIGLNSCRVFLQYLVWEDDGNGFLQRLDLFLDIAARHRVSVMPILLDDCAFVGKRPYLGPQAAPVPGVHNSGWTPSPGRDRVTNRAAWPRLEDYVTSVISRFAADGRVLAWDLYNEPGNDDMGSDSLPLLQEAFAWARAANPQQPLTAGTWNPELKELNEASRSLSDVLSFHNYDNLARLEAEIAELKSYGRPLLCTEWMRRTGGPSLFETHLPILRREGVGCWFWGLVQGKTQTHFPWGSLPGAPEPDIWFHDLLRADGTPYREAEVAVIREQIAPSSP